jgi:PiT family inorganic phosphate transporter
MGVGSTKRFSAVKWSVVERMAWAWAFTLPITALLSWAILRALQLAGWGGVPAA